MTACPLLATAVLRFRLLITPLTAAVVTLALLAVSVAAWLLASPARDFAEDGNSMWAALPEGIAIGVFLAGIESLFLSMIPIKFMDGHKLMSWNKFAWLGVVVASGFLLWHAMMNQERDSLNALGQTSTTTVLILMGSALLIAGVTHMFFRIRNDRSRLHAYPGLRVVRDVAVNWQFWLLAHCSVGRADDSLA